MTNKQPNTRPLPQPSELVAEVKRLTALADDHFRNARRLSEVVVARDAQIAKLQADGDKLAGFTYHRTNCPASWPAPLTGDCTCGLTQALTEWKAKP